MLVGLSGGAGKPGSLSAVTRFTRSARPTPDYETTELIFDVSTPDEGGGSPGVRLLPDGALLVPPDKTKPYTRPIGEVAERLLQHLSDGGEAEFVFANPAPDAEGLTISRDDLPATSAAFQSCVTRISRKSK
jgi:hypothetical protein